MTLQQKRASLAFEHVQQITDVEERPLYQSMAQKLPALIRTAGLCQAIHFVKSRAKEGKEGKEGKEKIALRKLLGHLAEQLQRTDPAITEMNSFCAEVRRAEVARYIWLTRETLACVSWYSRLSRSEWGNLPDTQP
jgi:CRISPR type III-B/RAMP module-associated protein Cmr5